MIFLKKFGKSGKVFKNQEKVWKNQEKFLKIRKSFKKSGKSFKRGKVIYGLYTQVTFLDLAEVAGKSAAGVGASTILALVLPQRILWKY